MDAESGEFSTIDIAIWMFGSGRVKGSLIPGLQVPILIRRLTY